MCCCNFQANLIRVDSKLFPNSFDLTLSGQILPQAYRRRDPSSADELEFMENLFDSLCSALSSPTVKTPFLKGEGIELMCLMLKEKKLSRTRAIKTLDHALQGANGTGVELCEKFVELLGLKTLFSAFMGKVSAVLLHSKFQLRYFGAILINSLIVYSPGVNN